MEGRMRKGWLGAMALLIGAGPAVGADALSADELATCAGHVQRLREESPRLLQAGAHLDAERNALMRRRDGLYASAGGDDLREGLERRQAREQLDTEMRAFNRRVEATRAEIAALNASWRDYDRLCSQRPYRRSDLERLPPAAQAAMRAGLQDVRVPYLPEALPESPAQR